MSTKIQINSLKALEALLNSDPEFAVEFRKSVLLEYEQKHIRPLIEAHVKTVVEAAVGDELGRVDIWAKGAKLADSHKTAVLAIAKAEGRKLLSEYTKEAIQTVFTESYVKATIESAVNAEIIEEVRRKVLTQLKG